MSLDLSLEGRRCCSKCGHSDDPESIEFFSANITHNLNSMFEAAGLYQILWYGDGYVAQDVIADLEAGLRDMVKRREFYETFNASNGWGKYEHALPWLRGVIAACRKYPTATLRCSR